MMSDEASNIYIPRNYPEKEFILKQIKGIDNKLYNLEIIKEKNEIIFKSNIIKDILDIQYSLNIHLKHFYNVNKKFRQYNSINEIYSKYFNNIKEENIIISSNDNKIIVYFIDGDKEKIPFILEPNEMKIDNTIRKICDKIKDIDMLKSELDKQINEKNILKNELTKQKNYNEKCILEIKKEIENFKNIIKSQKEIYDNNLGNIEKEINLIKKDINNQEKYLDIIDEVRIKRMLNKNKELLLNNNKFYISLNNLKDKGLKTSNSYFYLISLLFISFSMDIII